MAKVLKFVCLSRQSFGTFFWKYYLVALLEFKSQSQKDDPQV
jgi:hypothetical protein